MPGWLKILLNSATTIAGFIFTGGLGPLAVRAATTLIKAADGIATDAHQSGEMSDAELATWRADRDSTMGKAPEWAITPEPKPDTPSGPVPAPPVGQ